MDQNLIEQVRFECLRLGNEVISRYQQDANGCYWNTISIDRESNQIKVPQPALYSGVSGISLFCLELYKVSSEPNYLAYAESSLGWAVKRFQSERWEQFSLFSGKGGILYALLRFEAVTGKAGYLDAAISVATGNQNFITHCGDDIIGGSAGGALALLLLYERTKDIRFLHDAQSYADRLMQRMFVGTEGVYWERSPENITGLCGLAHGCSGIALPFLELYAVTGRDEYLWVAEEAFRYEDAQLRKFGRSWPDLRKGRFRPEDFENHEQAFKRNDKTYFTNPNEMDMWCHGAAGIGFARLRAYELTKKPEHLETSRRAVTTVAAAEAKAGNAWRTYTLCHGRFGNAALLRKWDRVHASNDYEDIVSSMVRDALESRAKLNGYLSGYGGMRGPNDMTEASLMMGLSGIGIFYASFLSDFSALDFLAPFLNSNARSDESRNPLDPSKAVIAKAFPRTMAVLGDRVELSFEKERHNAEDIIPRFIEVVRASASSSDSETVFDLEVQKFQFDREISSFVFTELCWEYSLKNALELQNDLSKVTLCLNPNLKLVEEKLSEEPTAILLIRRATATEEFALTFFAAIVLKNFVQPVTLTDVINSIQPVLAPNINSQLLEQMVLAQVQEAVQCGFLIKFEDRSLLEQP